MTSTATHTAIADTVHGMIEPWTRACLDRDWDTLLSMCTDDLVVMPPGAAAVTGPAVRPWLDSFPTIKAMSWDIDFIDSTDDLAFLRGPVAQTIEIDGQDQVFDGKYCDVMRRGSDGRWRFAVIIWNANAT